MLGTLQVMLKTSQPRDKATKERVEVALTAKHHVEASWPYGQTRAMQGASEWKDYHSVDMLLH